MNKKQILGVLRKHFIGEVDEDGAFRSAPHVNYDAVASEILALSKIKQSETLPKVDIDRVKWIQPH